MDKDIIEILPKNKQDIDDALEAKIVLDAVEGGEITDEFLDLIAKDIGLSVKKKDAYMAFDEEEYIKSILAMDDNLFENLHPRGFHGWFKRKKEELKAKSKINQIKIDFSKDNILPEINKEDAQKIGVAPKKVRLKKSIIERNHIKHPDIKDEEMISIIGNALYKPEHIRTAKGSEKYFHFIGRSGDKESPLVLLDVEISKDGYFDIVHYFKVRKENKEYILKNSKEAGLPLPA